MGTLIANASEGLAKSSMNRRGFLGRLARAAGGAAVLTAGLATVARADHCSGSHHCLTDCGDTWIGTCGAPCHYTKKNVNKTCYVIDCYTGASCGYTETVQVGCTGQCP